MRGDLQTMQGCHNICSALFLGTETKAFSFKIRNQLAHNKFANKKITNLKSIYTALIELPTVTPYSIQYLTLFYTGMDFIVTL